MAATLWRKPFCVFELGKTCSDVLEQSTTYTASKIGINNFKTHGVRVNRKVAEDLRKQTDRVREMYQRAKVNQQSQQVQYLI